MKAPRKTVKRPIYRYTGNLEKEANIDIKNEKEKDIKSNTPEKKIEILDTLKTPIIEFSNHESIDPLVESANDIHEDFSSMFNESFYDITEYDDDNALFFMIPIDFDCVI